MSFRARHFQQNISVFIDELRFTFKGEQERGKSYEASCGYGGSS